jgi:VWFA-related protein
MFSRRIAGAVLTCALAALVSISAVCQESQPPQPAQPAQESQPAQEAPSAQDQEPLETLKVDVNVVNVFFNAKDKKGLLTPNLKKEDFQIFEEGKPQTIKYFSAESNQPLTLGLLIDTSGSQARVLPMEQEVGAQFLNQVLKEKDLSFLISFDVNVELLQDYTNDGKDLRAGLRRTRVNSGVGGGGPGMGGGPVPTARPRGTLLYDAVYLAAYEKLSKEVGRKAMIILTDGEDQGSQETLKNAIEAAHKADAMVYVLLIADRDFYQSNQMGYSGSGDMKKLAEETGGRMIDVGSEEKKLRAAFDQIANELRSQYYIGYTPKDSKRDGLFRRIEIKPTNKDVKIQATKGYYARKAD